MITLSEKIIDLIQSARSHIAKAANTTMVFTYFQIGQMIVEELQQGETRAEYGEGLLKQVSADLTAKLGRGFSVDNLENMRIFYTSYTNQFQISENGLRKFENQLISENFSRKLPVQLLCKHKNQSMVEITLPKDNNQIFASKYQTIIPLKEDFINILKQYDEPR